MCHEIMLSQYVKNWSIKKLLGVVLCFAVGTGGYAQGKVDRPGYYIDRSGDKFEGYFAEKISQRDLKGVWFRESPGGEKEKVLLEDISRIYLSDGEGYLIYELPGASRVEQLILKKVVDGPTSLYRGKSSEKGAVFYWEGSGSDGNLLIDRYNFDGFARSIQRRCEGIDAANYRFNQGDLTDMVVAYNGCRNSGDQVKVLEEPGGFHYSIGFRPYWYTTHFDLAETTYYGRGEYSDESGFGAAVAFAWMVNPRLRVMLEAGYTRVLSSSNYVNVPPYDEPRTYSEVTVDLRYIDLPLLVQYSFPVGHFRPFLEGGLYIGIPLKRSLEDNLIVADPSHIQFKPSSVAFEESNFGYAVGAGAGLSLSSHFELEIIGRWMQAASSMKVVSEFNEGFPVFNNFRTDKLEVGIRLWWLGKSGK